MKKQPKDVDARLAELLTNVDLNKIVTLDKEKGLIYIGGKQADAVRLNNLKAEAEFLVKSELWSLIQETPKETAMRAVFVTSESLADLQKGKAALFLLSQIKNIVDIFKNYVPK